MKRGLFAGLSVTLCLLASSALVAATVYLNGFSAVVTIADTDNTFWCQISGGCASSNPLKRVTAAQIKAYIAASISLTGTPTAPTAALGTNTTQVATTAFVQNASAAGAVSSVSSGSANIVCTPTTGAVVCSSTLVINDISGSGTAIVTANETKLVKLGAFTYTLAQAGTTGFSTGWGTCLLNVGAGNATINATTSVFTGSGGSTSLVLAPSAWACPTSDGTNYQTVSAGNFVAGSNITITRNSNGTITLASTGGGAATDVAVGTTTVSGTCPTGQNLYNNGGVVGCQANGAGGGSGLFSQVLSATPTSASTGLTTWVNQGSCTVTDGATGVFIDCPSLSGGHNVQMRCKTAAATPSSYSVLIALSANITNTGLFDGVVFGYYDGTKFEGIRINNTNLNPSAEVTVDRWTNPTTYGSKQVTGQMSNPGRMWLKVRDDGTNIHFATSNDGVNFLDMYSEARAAYLSAPTNVCFGIDASGSETVGTLLSYASGS